MLKQNYISQMPLYREGKTMTNSGKVSDSKSELCLLFGATGMYEVAVNTDKAVRSYIVVGV